MGINENENVYEAALRAFPDSSSVDQVTAAANTLHRTHVRMSGLAVAVVRMSTELALLREHPLAGVSVRGAADMVWNLVVTHAALPGHRPQPSLAW